MAKEAITFGGVTAQPGTRATGWFTVLDTDAKFPVTVINGAGEGKTVLITSSIHGCEYPSIEAVFELAESIDPQTITGQLVFINPVNVDAFLRRRPYVVIADGKNLNRQFPGDPNGTISQKMAYVLTEEFQRRVDFHIDTHGGDIPERQVPYVYCPGVGQYKQVLAESLEATEYVLHADYVIHSHATNHAYTHAAIIGVPSIELELGESGTWTRKEVEQYKENIVNVLKWLQVYPGIALRRTRPARHVSTGVYLEADFDGRWYPFVRRDSQVQKGQKVGEIRDFFGKVLKEYYAEYDGVVLMVPGALAVQKGDPLVAYGA